VGVCYFTASERSSAGKIHILENNVNRKYRMAAIFNKEIIQQWLLLTICRIITDKRLRVQEMAVESGEDGRILCVNGKSPDFPSR
ncbi:MAG: hypothetical protein ABI977_22720, partial [Acidobacteriota bacterium]